MRHQEHLRLEELTYFIAIEQASQPMQTLPFLDSTLLILLKLSPVLHHHLPQIYLFTLLLKVTTQRVVLFVQLDTVVVSFQSPHSIIYYHT